MITDSIGEIGKVVEIDGKSYLFENIEYCCDSLLMGTKIVITLREHINYKAPVKATEPIKSVKEFSSPISYLEL